MLKFKPPTFAAWPWFGQNRIIVLYSGCGIVCCFFGIYWSFYERKKLKIQFISLIEGAQLSNLLNISYLGDLAVGKDVEVCI